MYRRVSTNVFYALIFRLKLKSDLSPPLTYPAVAITLSYTLLIVPNPRKPYISCQILVFLLNNEPFSIQFPLIALDMETINSPVFVQASRDDRQLRAIKVVVREVQVE